MPTKKWIYMHTRHLFVFWCPLWRGEAALMVTPKSGYCCNLFPLFPVVGLVPPLFFLLCLSQISLHTCILPILAVVFLVVCNLRASLSRLFSVMYQLSCWPCFQPISSGSYITMQALVPTSSRRYFILRLPTGNRQHIYKNEVDNNSTNMHISIDTTMHLKISVLGKYHVYRAIYM